MGQITILNLDDAVLAALERRAKASGRSLEDEARQALASAAEAERADWLAQMAALRARIGTQADVPAEALVRAARGAT